MSGFWKLITPEQFFKIAYEKINLLPKGTEVISFANSLKRVVAKDIYSPMDLPNFHRSTMDGYAVRSGDTVGVSEGRCGTLQVIGEVFMGEGTELALEPGQAAKIPTGGMLPKNADAVLMIEYTELLDAEKIRYTAQVKPWENVVKRGDDITQGTLLLPKGHEIRPQDIGALAGLGITKVEVFRNLEVAVFSTGDEIVPPEADIQVGEIRDINTYSVGAMLEEMRIKVRRLGIIEDSFDALKIAVEANLDCDMVIISGGSSVGVKDFTIEVINSLGTPGVLAHGVAVKPGKPTILAAIGNVPIIGLPGHPASSWTIFSILIKPLLQEMRGERIWQSPGGVVIHSEMEGKMPLEIEAQLSERVASEKGREEYIPVRLIYDLTCATLPPGTCASYRAVPMTGKSSLITTLVRGDGFFKIEREAEGLDAGSVIRVRLY